MANLIIYETAYNNTNGLIVTDDNGNQVILLDQAGQQQAFDDFINGTTVNFYNNTITTLGDSCFEEFSYLESVTTPSVTTIGNKCFYNCVNLSTLSVGNVTNIADFAFFGCRSLTRMPRASQIGEYAFQNCTGLTEIPTSSNVPLILTNGTFYGCTGLTEIILPDGSRTNDSTFRGCSGATRVVCEGDLAANNWNEQFSSHCFADCTSCTLYDFSNATFVWNITSNQILENINPNAKIVVPDSLYSDWVANSKWNKYAQYIISASDYANL